MVQFLVSTCILLLDHSMHKSVNGVRFHIVDNAFLQ